MSNAEHITVVVTPESGAFVKASSVLVEIDINGKKFEAKKTVPDDFFISKFDHIMDELREAVIEANGST